MLNEDPTVSIIVTGYSTATEKPETAEGRAKATFAYITSVKGISADRIKYEGIVPEPNTDEGPSITDEHADAANRKVEFKAQ